MANTLGNYNPAFYANTALIWLRKNLGLASRVHMGFDEERRTFGRGDTINIRRPSTFTAAAAPSSAADLSTESVSITLDQWQEVKFKLSDKELAYTGERIVNEHIAPAAYALADKIDQDLETLVDTVPNTHVPGAAAATVAGILATRKKLFDVKCPLADQANMFFMVSGAEEADLLALEAFSQHQGSAAAGVETQRNGTIGRRYGFEFFANQNVGTLTYNDVDAAASGGAINNTAGYAKGTTSIAVDGVGTSDVLIKGTVIEMDATNEQYVLTADATMATGAGTLAISPGLRTAVSDNDTFTVQQDNDELTQNVAFHRHWAALAMARLPDFSEFDPNTLGARVASVQDPVTGLAVRSRIYYVGDSSEMHVALDVLYGYKELNGDLACRYEVQT